MCYTNQSAAAGKATDILILWDGNGQLVSVVTTEESSVNVVGAALCLHDLGSAFVLRRISLLTPRIGTSERLVPLHTVLPTMSLTTTQNNKASFGRHTYCYLLSC